MCSGCFSSWLLLFHLTIQQNCGCFGKCRMWQIVHFLHGGNLTEPENAEELDTAKNYH